MRTTFINTLIELAEEDDRIFLIIADLGFSVVEEFERKFPKRFINVGIAEGNAVSIAAGLALSGKIPYVYSIASFITMRAFEQIRVDCAYMNLPVKLIGVGGGVAYGPAGATHHAIEDLAIMRSLPNMLVFAPGDPWETENIVKSIKDIDSPAYVRLSKNNEPILSKMNSVFNVGKANLLYRGDDLTLITTGNTFELGSNIGNSLRKKGIAAELVNMHTVKPIDKEYILDRIKNNKPIFTIEEHNIIAGLGSAVAEIISESKHNPIFKRFGIPDEYSHFVGSQNFIRKKWLLTEDSILNKIMDIV
jgi:transketolase